MAGDLSSADQALDARTPAARPKRDPLAALMGMRLTPEMVATMKSTRLLCNGKIAHQHLTAIIGPAGAGKTAVAKAIASELAPTFDVLYLQEDSSAGDLPNHFEHAQAHGYQLLCSTLAGSAPEHQVRLLRELAAQDTDLSRYFLVFDTLKKYADLMSKGGTRAFLMACRALTQRGATVLLLGHTNKHRGPDGKLVFEGVGDLRNDVDELFYLEALGPNPQGVATLTMTPDKVRCAIRACSFELDTRGMTLTELPRAVDIAALEAEARTREADNDVIEAVREVLQAGKLTHTETVRRAAEATGIGRNAVARVVGRYASADPSDGRALWIETRERANNARWLALPEVRT